MKITKVELEAKETEIKNLISQLAQAGMRESGLREQLKQATEAIEVTKRDRDSVKWNAEHYMKTSNEATTELEQLHALLDAFPDCPSREIEKDEKERDSKLEKRTAMTRLASWLVLRAVIVTPKVHE